MIKMQLIGNLGKDATKKEVNGKTVMNFSVAHTEKFRDATGNMKERTTWVECAYWNEKTGILPYLTKGASVYVEGNPDVRTYQTNDGRSGANLSLRVVSIQLLGGNRQDSEHGNNASGYTGSTSSTETVEDLPF